CWHFGFIEDGGGGLTSLHVEEIVAADGLDGQGPIIAGFAAVVMILGVIIHRLDTDAVGGEESFLAGVEVFGLVVLAGVIGLHGLVVERVEFVGEVVVFHGRFGHKRHRKRKGK